MIVKTTKIALILTLCLISTVSVILPNCQTAPFYKILPMVPEQTYAVDLSQLFTGYNLRYNVSADPDLQKYVKLRQKVTKLKEQYPDDQLLGLKSYHLAKIGNSWGQQFVALTEQGDRTRVQYGILSDSQTVPVINNRITVQNYANTTCFDALLLPVSNTIIVDCTERRTSNNSRGQIYQNIFYYFYINNGTRIKNITNQMYAPFQQIKRRKIDLYQDANFTYVLRTYFADQMTHPQRDNTYLEVFMMQDPLNPWIVGIIDRSFLGKPKLRITDVRVYLNEIYILDYLDGVHRVYISISKQLQYQGTYQAKGFTKLTVFSPNLDNRIELALANDHKIHEIDWTNLAEPRLLNKYSLLPDSNVLQLFLNERFLFVRSSAIDSNTVYNYTWVFTRGDRTFTRAFATLNHTILDPNSLTFIDLNEQKTYLLVISDQALTNYAFDDPSFTLQFDQNEDLMDTIRNFTLIADSTDPTLSVTCTLTVNFTLLDQNNRTMWPVGTAPPSRFSANYPGKVRLQLGEYILGPNVTYRIRQNEKGQLTKAKVYQSEQLNVTWEKSPPFSNVTFLQTETISGAETDVLMIYTQDTQNNTYVSYCHPKHQDLQVHCNRTDVQDLGGKITNWATAIVRSAYTQQTHHILAYTTGKYYNKIFLQDLSNGQNVSAPILPENRGFPANISSLTVTGKYLYVVLHHIKNIQIYNLEKCIINDCNTIGEINYLNMYKRNGLRYFSPQTVHSSRFHPDILFIKTADSIIAVDLSKQTVPKLLAQIYPVDNVTTQFTFQVNSNFLVVTVAPNLIQEYDVSRIYLKQITKTKKYPLYGYKLPRNYDFGISDYGNCVYLSTVTEGGDYNIFVYRSGLPAVGSLYNQIDLYAFQNILIDASGYIIDYVTVISGKQLRLFRQYEKPQAEIENPSKDYSFHLEYLNSLDSAELQTISVTIINLPTYITVNPYLQDIMNTKDYFYSGQNRLSEVNDTDWYKGNVLYIRSDCRDCPDKIRVNNHIQREASTYILPQLTSYIYTEHGGEVLSDSALLRVRSNGTVREVVTFASNPTRHCLEVAAGRFGFTIAGCVQDNTVFLQTTSSVARKGFAFEPQETNAMGLLRLQVAHEIVMLVDTEADCYRKKRGGGILLYAISTDVESDVPLEEIQTIDGNDFGMRELGTLYFNNAELYYHAANKAYRLYITEMNRGLLIMYFTRALDKVGIVVRQTYFVQLRSMLQSLGESLPYDATFQAVTVLSSYTNPTSKRTTDKLLITTGRYHTIQLALVYDNNFNLIQKTIERLYLRYSYYEVSNQIKQNGELFMVRQMLPEQYNNGTQTQQLYTVYSTSGQFNGTVESRGLIGALPLVQNTPHRFDFNKTVDQSDQHLQPRLGVVVVEEGGELVRASLHRNLSVFTTELLDTQIIYLDLINDFNLQKIRILINGRSPFPEWKLITIIIFSILGGFLLIGLGVYGFKKLKAFKDSMPEQRETLISEDTSNEQN